MRYSRARHMPGPHHSCVILVLKTGYLSAAGMELPKLRQYSCERMSGIAHRTCRRCGRAPAGHRLVDDWCVRCRMLALVDGFDDHLAGHTRRVTSLAMLICDELDVDAETRGDVELG